VASGNTPPDTQSAATRSKNTDGDDSNQRPGTGQAKAAKDSDPPQPVADIEAAKVTARRLTISWPAASDNVGVIGYRIWLNGLEYALGAWLRQVGIIPVRAAVGLGRAVDAAGNQSQSSPTLVITRPSPEPTATTPTPEPSDSPTPSGEPSEHSHPDAQSPESPSAEATGQKSTAEPTPH
jgi:hypothetical protein